MHGMVMVFFFLIPSIPAVLGNFLVPMMIGAKDLAFPRINLLSWYLYIIGGVLMLHCMLTGGVDTGWTFYTPYSTAFTNTKIVEAGLAIFVAGFSSILTGLNFVVTIHRMRAPGMTWSRLPLFIWAHYATSIHGTNNPPDVDIRLVVVRDYEFAIISERIVGGFAHNALDNPEAMCLVVARLNPEERVDWPQRHQELIRKDPRAARDECVRNMEVIWGMASLYREEHGTNAGHLFTLSELAEYRFKGPLHRCPLGTNDYPPFKYESGPRCPNAPSAHMGAKPPESRGLVQ